MQTVCLAVLTLMTLGAFSVFGQDTSAPASAPAAQEQGTAAPAAPGATPAAAATPATAPAAPQPLPNPSMTAPLQTSVPHTVDAGPFGKIAVTGILSGMGLTQGNWAASDQSTHWDVSNAQVFLQKTSGWWQFYLQGGAYNLPALGTPFLSTGDTVKDIYGPLPTGYLKLVKGNYSVEIGELPTLIGAEYTFDFENMNIERGVLWNQENAISRGVQLNGSYKKLSGSIAWTDGFFSNRYTWLTGTVSYAINGSNTLAFIGGGNLGEYDKNTLATPLALNNSQIYNLIYTYSHESWMITPYFQYTDVPTNAKIGIAQGASTRGAALLLNYNFKHGISMAVRPEYISSTGSAKNGTVNLLYGPGSDAFALTVTPTYTKGAFFLRGDISIVHATSITAGDAFGPLGADANQPRGVVEAGFMF